MTLPRIVIKTEKLIADNSPAILTGIGVTGTLTTAYLTGRASFRAAEILNDVEFQQRVQEGKFDQKPLEPKEKFLLVWKLYIPAGGVAISTIACIIAANQIGTRRTAAMAAAYSISERAFVEYKDKVVEKLGENKEREVREEIAKDRINRQEPPASMLVVSDTSEVLCHDAFSNQYFKSDMETLRKAQNDVNAQILHSDFATVNDFYDFVDAEGLEHTSVSGDLGWNTDKMMEIDFQTVLYKEKTPCISVVFATVPVRDPWRFC